MFLRLLALLLPCTLLGGPACSSDSGARSSLEGDAAQARLEAEMAARGIYPEHRATRVTLKDHRSGVTIGLLNESHTAKADYYSREARAPTYKVVPDLDMGALLKQLEEFGFFEDARPGSARVPGARVTVQVERGGQTWTLAWTSADVETRPERVEQVRHCGQAIQAVYNVHPAFQLIDNDQGARFFEEEQQRLREGSPRR